jgi:hypothetical protein
MKSSRAILVSVLAVSLLLLGGCEAFIPVPAPPPPVKPPFSYEPLGVRNSCFVESVHFYDVYHAKTGEGGWVRVFQWGNQEGDYKIGLGHAVAVYVADGKLFGYDINFGFWPIALPLDRRADVTDVGPKIFVHYPQFKPVFARYRDDSVHAAPLKPPEFLFYHANRDVRDATRVASELGRFRRVSVVDFNFIEKGTKQASAATVFVFDSRLCVYFPRNGTHVSNLLLPSVDNLHLTGMIIQRIYPGATDIRPQAGGYLLFPPKEPAK